MHSRYEMIQDSLTEKNRRIWCATEAKTLGRGGMGIVQAATGISYPTIKKGLLELLNKESGNSERLTQLQFTTHLKRQLTAHSFPEN